MEKCCNVAFYVMAHQDDWQLFMSPQAYQDIISTNNKIVFIYTTAGDAGKGTGWWQARRAGSIGSIQFALRKPLKMPKVDNKDFNGHSIPYYKIDNTRSYFINIPDGNTNGQGFSETGNVSLQKLEAGQSSNVPALVESSSNMTQYSDWNDFTSTLKAIMDFEVEGEKRDYSWVNYLDPEHAKHSDHKYTGEAVKSVVDSSNSKIQQAKYLGYSIEDKKVNVEGKNLIMKAGMYLTYNQIAFEMPYGEDHLSEGYINWLFRQYLS